MTDDTYCADGGLGHLRGGVHAGLKLGSDAMPGDLESEQSGRVPDIGLDEAYAVDGPEDNRALYAAWADTYESGFIAPKRYVYHRHVAEIFSRAGSPGGGAVLDVGCGTGIVGEELRRLGVAVIDGLDISPEMLHKARGKVGSDGAPVYRRLIEADLTGPIGVATDSYAAIVSAGAFTHGHVGPEALSELLRVASPGARCVIGINSVHFDEHGFGERLDQYRHRGAIVGRELVRCPVYKDSDDSDPDQVALVAVFTVG